MKKCFLGIVIVVSVALLASMSHGQTVRKIRIMAPCTTGCSWLLLAQNIARVLKQEGLVTEAEVYSITGNGIPAALQKFVTEQRGNPNELMAFGVGTIGATVIANSTVKISDFTPVARLTAEYETLFVPVSSPFQTVSDLIKSWKANPDSIIWGGSSRGSTSHLQAGLLGKEVGIDLSKIRFLPSNGNLQAAQAMVNGEIGAVFASYAAVEDLVQSNKIKPLAISAPKRIQGLTIPTYLEQGLNFQYLNWRGVLAPPGITTAQRTDWQLLMGKLNRNKAWRTTVVDNNWIQLFQPSESFRLFLNREDALIVDLQRSLGLIK